MSATLEIKGVEKSFVRGDRAIQALANVSLHVEPAQFVCVIGPSGCGKSTLLHIVGGFETPTAGTVLVDGEAVSRPGRDRGMVFQHATLFPWWNIERNVAWPLLLEGQHKQEAAEHAGDLLSLVGLEGFGESYPGELSGGMQQRAALARTLALEPKVLLMDEPFGALDAQTREVMQEELNRIWQEAGITVVFITHDIHEAVFLGDRVVVMSGRPGRFVEDIPIEIPRPRGPEVKNGPEMQAYHAQLWKLIRNEQQAAATA